MKTIWSFDGKGINGGNEYMSRIATLTDHGHSLGAGQVLAAAPDLLAALESIVGMAECFAEELNKDHPVVIDARAAIAKAKG